MKQLASVIAFTLFCAVTLCANSKLPKGVYTFDQLDAALAEARSKNRPVAFLYSKIDSTCPLCVGAQNTFMNEFDRTAVIIFVENNDLGKMPEPVKAVHNKDTGKYIPKMYIFTPDLSRHITSAHYEKLKEGGEKYIKQLKREVRAANT